MRACVRACMRACVRACATHGGRDSCLAIARRRAHSNPLASLLTSPRASPLALSPHCRARLLHAGEDRLAARRRRRLLSARFVEFRGAVEAALETRAADEARVARAGLRTWRAELRREKGGVRHKRRVLRQWGGYMVSWRHEWPERHRRRRLLLRICERYLLCGCALIY